MSESMPRRRVVLEVRGTMVLNIDAANEFAGLLREAIQQAGEVE